MLIAYASGHAQWAAYLNVPHLAGAGELVVVAGGLVGGILGFLWFNCHPAQVFMGNTGSLALGGVLGLMAVIVRQELLFAMIGGVFVDRDDERRSYKSHFIAGLVGACFAVHHCTIIFNCSAGRRARSSCDFGSLRCSAQCSGLRPSRRLRLIEIRPPRIAWPPGSCRLHDKRTPTVSEEA